MSPAVPITLGILTAGQGSGSTNNQLLYGYAFTETTGATPAEVQLINGNDARGEIVFDLQLTAGQSVRDVFPLLGLAFDAGVWVQVVSGTVRATIIVLNP